MGSQPEGSAAPPQQATPPAAACFAAAAYFCFTTSSRFCWLIGLSFKPNAGTSVRDLYKRLRRYGPAARAAFLIEEAQYLAQRIGIGRVPEKCPDPADVHKACLPELFQMVGEGGGRYFELFLHFARHHPGRVRRKQQPDDFEARFGAESGETIGRTADQERIGFSHASIFVEIQKTV